MSKWAGAVAAIVCSLLATVTEAQKATEMYIPIGRSPGLSGTKTSIGTILTVDAATQEIVLEEGSRERTVRCTERTRIWLDCSQVRISNREGSLADCRAPLRIEVKYVDDDKDAGVAEWIKVELVQE